MHITVSGFTHSDSLIGHQLAYFCQSTGTVHICWLVNSSICLSFQQTRTCEASAQGAPRYPEEKRHVKNPTSLLNEKYLDYKPGRWGRSHQWSLQHCAQRQCPWSPLSCHPWTQGSDGRGHHTYRANVVEQNVPKLFESLLHHVWRGGPMRVGVKAGRVLLHGNAEDSLIIREHWKSEFHVKLTVYCALHLMYT